MPYNFYNITNIHVTSRDVIDRLTTQELTSDVAAVSYLTEHMITNNGARISSFHEFNRADKSLTGKNNLPEVRES